jgi:hypothetical protein
MMDDSAAMDLVDGLNGVKSPQQEVDELGNKIADLQNYALDANGKQQAR